MRELLCTFAHEWNIRSMFDVWWGEHRSVCACVPRRRPSDAWILLPMLRLLPLRAISLRGSRGSETDHFLNHSWALPGKERHAESWGTAMRNVSLFPSYAMIYDTMVVTDLIITVYFPSEGKKVKVSNFACFPFIPRLLFHRQASLFFISSLFNRFFFFFSHLPTPPSYSSHKYPFKFTNTIKNSPHQRLVLCLTRHLVRGESLDTASLL